MYKHNYVIYVLILFLICFRWTTTPDTVNAFYEPSSNTIHFPAGILQLPFFNKARSNSLNYGSIGTVIGHEFSHAFDSTGRKYDKYGNLNQWWNNKTVDAYQRAANCMINQYSQFKVNGENINGNRTLGEPLIGFIT